MTPSVIEASATALPDLSSDYSLSEEQIARFRQNGHVLLRGVATPEAVAAYRPALLDTVRRYSRETRKLEDRDTYGKAFLQITNLWVKDDTVRRFVLARRFAKIAADLMGVDGVRIYHDQALFKEAGGGHTPWHQDQQYWPLDTKTVTLWMPLVDASEQMGTMRFASGSHTLGYLGEMPISDQSEAEFDKFIAERGFPIANCGAMAAGDATFHAGWTLHGAPGNTSDTMREVMTIIYLADGARIIEPDSPYRQNDLRAWFPGLKPGDPAASDINPLVYSRT
jgi:ectoine hydroxylase-related dioxygenase (phytanoyl-CoA dioxygenase family)